MIPDEEKLLARRQDGLETFYKELMPVLVDFVDRLGIRPPHEVLNHAEQFAPYLETALAHLEPADEDDRVWLTARVAYFVGEYFVQKYKGCWLVNDVKGSKSFARYVVGRFSKFPNGELMVDPFEVSFAFVGSARPRKLGDFLNEVEDSVVKAATLH
jgi:hypothetical protein